MFVENYVKLHNSKGVYIKSQPDERTYVNVQDWTDFIIEKSLVFSHRCNFYTKEKFTEGLHSHNYYELIIYIKGAVEYINETSTFTPKSPCAIWFKPGEMHTARLISASEYERIVIYFDEQFFEFENNITPILNFTTNSDSFAIDIKNQSEILSLMQKIQNVLESSLKYKYLSANCLITQLFLLLDANSSLVTSTPLDDTVSKIKNYIDNEFAYINNVNDIAKRFYISREHLSRQFKKRYNVCVKDYVRLRRITESIKLLKTCSVTTSAFKVGFNSMSAFISAFKFYTGQTPSEYKKNN